MTRKEQKQIKNILSLAAAYQQGLAEILAASEQRKHHAADIIKELADTQLKDLLRSMDVSLVNRDKLGIRVSALKAAGIENMEQLCAMNWKQLSRLDGIGIDSAHLIYTVAGKIQEEAANGLKVRISPENKDEASTKLLVAIKSSMNDLSLEREAQEIRDEYDAEISALYSQGRIAAGGLKWTFSSPANKRLAESACGGLYTHLTGDYGSRVRNLLEAYDSRTYPDAEECWAEFEVNSAAYYAGLEYIDRSAGNRVDNSYSGIPAELVRQVEQYSIHVDKLRATLRSYQDFGVRYILRQQQVLLGDEMGLGKTVQAIAAMVSLAAEGESHFMVVCPASVLVNWAREIKHFSELQVTTIKGGDVKAVLQWRMHGGVAVTTYESISRFTLPDDFGFAMLVADEAHYVKNPLAIRTQALLRLKHKARRALFMTGTPLENNVDEMAFILKCLRPDIVEEIRDMMYISSAPQFREKIAPVYLRRTREDVLTELPELIEKEQWCQMGKAEWESYLLSVMSDNFMAMRQVSWDVPNLKKSSKAKRLLQLCDMAEQEGRKLIIFSFFRDTIDAVGGLLGEKAMGPITGSVSSIKRQQIVDDFTAAPNGTALLCQVQAGGTGLNIQAASVVIFCEPQIKPSMENQAISRAYRMGQSRSVIVHRLLCDNTVDERILEILREKQEAFDYFADESSTGTEYIKGEKSIAAAIIAAEKERLSQEALPEDDEEDENE